MNNKPWKAIFDKYKIAKHDFNKEPFIITAEQIKTATSQFKTTNEREVRILCKQDCREDRPDIFIENKLFLLPVKNGIYVIVKGDGYIDIPEIKETTIIYKSKLDFDLDTSKVGNSEMQHLDFAYASSLVRTFLEDNTLVLTIRGRKYTPRFLFFVGKQKIEVTSVQTEVDAGYEGKNKVALIEAKNAKTNNVIIRQLFYPFKQWSYHTKKEVVPLFFEKQSDNYLFWQFEFKNKDDYNSIKLVKSCKYEITL
ncbi:MAG: hypothetical protein AUJ85_01770 [Elusimicrobia bacterium CG1_02_37_114]|nr:MAG: hypothetical protein AUJ85_01770 [Elusimicrobia bacterium CG1_02_37_114]PIV52590.1 MAG: hypothetical protein COS17_08340 [Elusimicrobia bacterium CG02_land_8_20_14_3_00_37_13]PIZ12837.1 MAG: hypothetical protein COY53_07905 [Elusimicrobia bacterium CG_4_10_14_0_8_um_filter_37_32]